MPPNRERQERLAAVLHVLYLIFTEGHTATLGPDLRRVDLGPEAGLAALATLAADPRLAGHHRLDAARAHLYEMAGDRERAVTHYRAAAGGTTSLPEQHYLRMRAARLSVGE